MDKIKRALTRFPRQISKYLQAAGKESASRVILPTQGLKKYPPRTAANLPPTPYYIRGRGTQYKTKNNLKSERLGTQWYVAKSGNFGTEIGNRARYAKWVVGEQQSVWMAVIGWRRLAAVVEEKMSGITAVYQAWIDKLIRDLFL